MPPRTPRSNSNTPSRGSAAGNTARRRTPQHGAATTSTRPDWNPYVPKKTAEPLHAGYVAPKKFARDARIEQIATPDAEVVADARSFAELGVPGKVIQALTAGGITSPFPIQAATLPDSLAGRDIIGRGRTGSGKTIAFAIPTVAALSRSKTELVPLRPRALILVPTRELAAQVAETFVPLAKALGLSTAVVVGGVPYNKQISALKQGLDVLIATPGRLEDLIKQRLCRLDKVEVSVLDEADMMADLGFLPPVQRLLDATPAGQRMLFSATIDRAVDGLVRRYLNNPVTHEIVSTESQAATMEHHVLTVVRDQKHAVVQELASGQGRSLLFTRTKHGAMKLAANLTAAGIPAVDLHGDLSHRMRERNLAAYSSGKVRVLVATDIAARGIHVDDISLVVHVDPPAEHKAYLHRSGRTARAGASGIVVTVAMPDQRRDVASLMRGAAIKPVETAVVSGSREIRDVVGPAAEYVDPEMSAVLLAPIAERSNPRRSGRPGGSSYSGGSGGSGQRRSAAAPRAGG
ncbi:MAG: box helicase domain protein, partial [Frankiales bacterium]|nr:box helicase domain protein [Frankiales bacterium]